MSARSVDGQTARPPRRFWPLLVLLFLGFVVGIQGCGGCSSKTVTHAPTSSNPATDSAGRDLLDAFLHMVQPDQLGIRADANLATGSLNHWRTVQMEVEKKDQEQDRLSDPLVEETRMRLERDLSAEAAKRAARDAFSDDDIRHIRTARLMKAVVGHVAKGVDTELGRAQIVFDYVTRNVQLVADENALPLTPYEMLVFGEGTAKDRAWVFAELLRQLNQDTVIVQSLAEPVESAPWFVGAVVGDGVYLFDPARSTPVPLTLSAKTLDITPATIADLSQPKVLNALTAGTDAKLTPQMFEQIRLEIIGTSSLWSPRLAVLQGYLAGEASAVVSQKLTGESGDPSAILNRIAAKDVRLWNHPETRLEEFATIENLSDRWKPFEAPIAVDPKTREPVPGTFTKLQLHTRTRQLLGECGHAIPAYSQVLYEHLRWASVLEADVLSFHADAAEDANYWSAVCQMELGDFEHAEEKLAGYIQKYERFAIRHGDHARVLLARCFIELDRPKEATLALSPLKPSSPEYLTAMFLKHALGTSGETQPSPVERKPNVTETATTHQPAIAEKRMAQTPSE